MTHTALTKNKKAPPVSLSMRDDTYCHFAQNFASSARPASESA